MPWPGTSVTKKKTDKVAIFHASRTNASNGPCVFSVTEPITSSTAQRWPMQITANPARSPLYCAANTAYLHASATSSPLPCRVPRLGLGLGFCWPAMYVAHVGKTTGLSLRILEGREPV